jgi:enamine deaminase RidA (YjgF/YER057c/UK114 family)
MLLLICGLILVLLVASPSLGQQSLVGTYKVVSQDVEVGGTATQPMGKAPRGAQGTAEDNLKQKNITLPAPSRPVATYVPAVRSGNLLFLSGHAVERADIESGTVRLGKVGKDLSLEQAYQAARVTGLHLLATVRATLGSLDKVKRIVKVLGMVNSAPGFTNQPKVINGFSDLMIEVFGDKIGTHALQSAWLRRWSPEISYSPGRRRV